MATAVKHGKIDKALSLAAKVRQCNNVVRNISHIANSPLPPHKQKKFDLLLADALVASNNADNKLAAVLRKLNQDELVEFTLRSNA